MESMQSPNYQGGPPRQGAPQNIYTYNAQPMQPPMRAPVNAQPIVGAPETIMAPQPQIRQQVPQQQQQQQQQQVQQPTQLGAQQPPPSGNTDFFGPIAERLTNEPNLSPAAANSFGEVWLIILCQSLKIPPEQAIALLRAPGALSRGMAWGADKGRAKDILRWMRAIFAHRRTIVACMNSNGGVAQYDPHAIAPAVYSCLHPLHACLFSKDTVVVAEAAKTIEAVVALLPAEVVHRVVTTSVEVENPRQPNIMLMGIVAMARDSRAASKEAMARTVTTICGGGVHLREFIMRMLVPCAHLVKPLGFSLLNDFVLHIAGLDPSLASTLCSEGIVDQLVQSMLVRLNQYLIAPSSRDPSNMSGVDPNTEELIAELSCLGELYAMFSRRAKVFSTEQGQKMIIKLLKKGTRHAALPVQVAATAVLFALLDVLAARSGHEKEELGPQVYKALIFLLVEAHADAKRSAFDGVLRDFVASNLCNSLEKQRLVPVDVLVKPLVSQIQLVGVSMTDFEILEACAAHPRLSSRTAEKLTELLTLTATSHPIYWFVALEILCKLTKRYNGKLGSPLGNYLVTIVDLPEANLAEQAEKIAGKRQRYLAGIEKMLGLHLDPIFAELMPLLESKADDLGVSSILESMDLRARAQQEWNRDDVLNRKQTLGEDLGFSGKTLYDGQHLKHFHHDRGYRKMYGHTTGFKPGREEDDGEDSLTTSEAYDKIFGKAEVTGVRGDANDGGGAASSTEERQDIIQGVFSKLQKIISKEHQTVRSMFAIWDKDQSGSMSKKEFAKALANLGVHPTKEEFMCVVNFLDADGDGSIAYLELIPHLKKKPKDANYTGNRVIGDKGDGEGRPEKTNRDRRIDEELRRIKMKRDLQDQRKRLDEERRKLKSARVRDKLRKKFGHIHNREVDLNGLSEKIHKTGRAHQAYLREQRAQKVFKESETAFHAWQIPLKYIFEQFTQFSEGFSQSDKAGIFDLQLANLCTMQENEWLLFLREIDIVPSMMGQDTAKHIFHSINASRAAHDSLDYVMFNAALVRLLQHDLSITKQIDNLADRVIALMSYIRQFAFRLELEIALFPQLSNHCHDRILRLGKVGVWEAATVPMIDVVYKVPDKIKQLMPDAVVDVSEILDDVLGMLLGPPGHFLTPSQQPRPKHAQLHDTYGQAIVEEVLQEEQNEDAFFSQELADLQVQQMIISIRRLKQSEVHSRITSENPLLRKCLQTAETRSIKGAANGIKSLTLTVRKELREPDEKTKVTINRLYQPAELKATKVQTTLRKQKKASFGAQTERFGPFQTGKTKYALIQEATAYNNGIMLEMNEDKTKGPGSGKKIKKTPERHQFGYSALSMIPLKCMGIGRACVNMIGIVADACVSGKAQQVLKRFYKMPSKGAPEDISFYNDGKNRTKNQGKTNSTIHLYMFEKKVTVEVTDDMKKKPKFDLRKRQGEREYKELMAKKERIRLARKKQLEADLKIQKEEKKKDDAKKMEEKKAADARKRAFLKKKADEKKKYFEDNKLKINEWKKQQAEEKKMSSASLSKKRAAEKKKIESDFENMKSRRDHLDADRLERIRKEAAHFGIEFEEINQENYSKKIHNLNVVEKKIRDAKMREKTMKENADSAARYQSDREKKMILVKEREAYEAQKVKELEEKLQSSNLNGFEYVGEMMKVRLGIGGPDGGDHKAMKVSDLFSKMDGDDSGSLQKDEMKESFAKMKIVLSDEQFEEFFVTFDPNGDGEIDYKEFLVQMRSYIHGEDGIVKRSSHVARNTKKKKSSGDDKSNTDGDGSTSDKKDQEAREATPTD